MTDLEFPRRQKRARLSVSVPRELAQWARDCAKRNDVTVSAVVELAITRWKEARDVPPTDEEQP